ncbi:YciI family protein [Nannocystis bainbridge]|uniref:YciI family protein n=1 Tax=Nannocystis bainbridge TaxID=2995303 RepID=A0ABT5DRH0_9BACT|nr:YciI family protein [Nannocystis bainbridge]MDC0716220.1 YciI family protein [Nannocystis bainbridge]
MRFMIMHKNDPQTEAGHPPPMDLVTRMGEFVGEHAKAGRLVDGAGLGASKTRTRLVFCDGRCTVKHGPYRGENELPAAMLLLKVRTREEAIGWAERYGKILGDGELELGKLNEPWDIGLMPAPEDPPLQMLLIEKADQATEAGGRSSKQKAGLTRLKTEMIKAGVLVRSLRLHPSAEARRMVFTDNHLRTLDGPFAESKELIGGFAVLELSGMEEAVELCRRYAEILGGTLELDLRLVDPNDPTM